MREQTISLSKSNQEDCYKILNTVIENKVLPTAVPVIEKFIKSLHQIGAEAFRISGIEEAVDLYHKSGPGIENILNTVPELGIVNAEVIEYWDAAELQPVYQIWVRGALGVAENGRIWLEESSIINTLLPFQCEYLVIVLDATRIVANVHEAYKKIEIAKDDYGVFLAGPATEADVEPALVVGDDGIKSLIVYLIDAECNEKKKLRKCDPGCCC